MKIFYAVQATGNGHISRAMELLPYLQQYGKVDIFLSGDNSHLELNAPVKYRSKGISLFYNCKGGLNYWKTMKQLRPINLWEEVRDLPVEKYDLVLNDFDFITSTACMRKKIPSVHFGHQASFQSLQTPRPSKKSLHGEWLLRNYVKATDHIGLHFKQYDDNIFPAIVKKEILDAEPGNQGHITVYLSSYCEKQLLDIFMPLKDVQFHIFSRETTVIRKESNITFLPVNKKLFNQSFINCAGIITGGGFETPAEALHLGKRLMVIPIKGQYEQQCNAEALRHLGVTCLKTINEGFQTNFSNWMNAAPVERIDYSRSVPQCLEHLFSLEKREVTPLHFPEPELAC
jgi:uncharacterized protein (TIGR00661 family)